ncbi:MAG TPA: GvpL/GvpF family gas vesicle protein [Amycolatopsis sp.]|uniref:GvpL/GvpF family gas vesicle protein n=1 Tax=Amycolatopsis sp. TaxID=37632 RepID=UPI002B479D16|nr:GvpL/GvpF family gas vesicle protein [Amycolatopsis sp.]HKS46891.1 GvpL/GvpF family gas vesicle protein [Amycolatopsis sp.]
MNRGLCAYAITRDGAFESDPDIFLLAHRGLGLVVAEVDLVPFAEVDPSRWVGEPAEDDPLVVLARRHDEVVRAVFEHLPVLPLRFGTVLKDREAAVALLDERHEQASGWLDRVEGHREWGVRARRRPPKDDAVSLVGLSGTEYLARRRKRLNAADRETSRANEIRDALARHATDSAARARRSADVLFDTAYLVPVERESEFQAEVGRWDGLEVTGPWPPYSFTGQELSVNA